MRLTSSSHAPGNFPQITVTDRPLADLKSDPRNPRRHSPAQIRQIARSIETFGFNVPILVDAGLKVIAGHGRLLAGQKLGLSVVPTIQLDHLTEAQSRAFTIADNRLTENSAWDERLLAEQRGNFPSSSWISAWRQPASRWARSI